MVRRMWSGGVRRSGAAGLLALGVLMVAWLVLSHRVEAADAAFREPIKLSSKDGVLEVRLIAHQGRASLDTVARPGRELPAL